ncbi:MAG: hypothetical protein QNL81_02290, partial [Euryarchaeota archaeon]
SSSDRELAEKEAELQSIYGDENTADLGFASNSGYSQAPQMSAGSISSAAEASALLQEDESSTPLPTAQPAEQPITQSVAQPTQNEAPKAIVESGGISLPEGVLGTRPAVVEQPVPAVVEQPVPVVVEQPVPAVVEQQIAPVATELKCVCESCGTGFEITLPAGVPKAIVACPSCQVDNMIGA